MTISCCCDNLPVCVLYMGENGLEKYRLAKNGSSLKSFYIYGPPGMIDLTD